MIYPAPRVIRLTESTCPLREFRDRLLDRIESPQITVACCRKLLRLMYAMVRDRVGYQAGRLAVADPEQAAA